METTRIIELAQPEAAAPLFQGWQETLIWSCLQGVMGHIYVDLSGQPCSKNDTAKSNTAKSAMPKSAMPKSATAKSAMALLGDFCFLAGEPSRELALYKPAWCTRDFMIMVPQTAAWAELIKECYGDRAKETTRYAIKKEPGIFDRAMLQRIVASLPEGFTLVMLDEALFQSCREISWCQDFVSQYTDYAMFRQYGLGAIILKDGEPVSGASSYSSYLGGIEIEIDTREDFRRRGLASVCGAKLILACLDRGWYPSWDAQNKHSVALAEKLGYHYSHDYTAYEIWG